MSTRKGDHRHLRTSRRAIIRLLPGAGATLLLATCSPAGSTSTATTGPMSAASSSLPSPTTAAATPTSAVATTRVTKTSATPAAGPTSAAQAGATPAAAITIPDTGAKLPTEKVTLRWTESSQFSKAFLPSYWAAYQKAHPNITVQYDNLPDADLAKVLQLAFQSSNEPDVFRLLPQIIPSATAVAQKLVQPLDDYVPKFAQWKAAFPAGSFTEGVNVFNGKTYTFPMLGKFTWTLQINRSYFDEAGIDPVKEPLTWDSFRAAAKKLTQQGKGKYYGFVIGGSDIGRWSAYGSIMGQLAGAAGGEFNYKTGHYNYTSDGVKAAVDLLLALKSDGSVLPGSVSINSDEARNKMPQGQAAMILNETGIVPFWIKQSPNFKFDIADLPVPDLNQHGTIYAGPPDSFWWIGAQSKLGAVAGDIFAYLGSEDGQKTWQRVGGGSLPVIFPSANQVDTLDPRIRYAYAYFDRIMRIGPSPQVRNPDVAKALQEMHTVTPDFGTVLQGIFTGQVSDVKKALQDLQDRSEAEIDRAIKAAQAKGAKVSHDDWVFPNWDPSKNYTQADYDALKKA
ncbi:MAG TPA: extracellular solute-binding protein [Chloroflexota bacterium]|nr:extracellular solute-binding protein [Chloroflexota bacterium]